MKSSEILNTIIERNGYRSYLEIGVSRGATFNAVKCERKLGIEPQAGLYAGTSTVLTLTSDRYFLLRDTQFDLVFIDGLHLAEQAERDIKNALDALTPTGTIVLHDCNPPRPEHAGRQPVVESWTGDVYKTWVRFIRNNKAKALCYTIATGWGHGVLKQKAANTVYDWEPMNLTWHEFDESRRKLLNLVTPEEFLAMR